MVTVTNYHKVNTKEGKSFIALELSGGVELIQSSKTGRFYASSSMVRIPSTFSEETAKLMIGTRISGQVIRTQVDPYEFTNKTTGEVMVLSHAYSYQPEGSLALISQDRVTEMQSN